MKVHNPDITGNGKDVYLLILTLLKAIVLQKNRSYSVYYLCFILIDYYHTLFIEVGCFYLASLFNQCKC